MTWSEYMIAGLVLCCMLASPILLVWMVWVTASPGAALVLVVFYVVAGAAFAGAPKDYPGPLGGND